MTVEEIREQFAGDPKELLYADVEASKKALEEMGGQDELVAQAGALLEQIEHEIWVQSREATEEVAEALVPKIPDSIMKTLAGAPMHDGKPRGLLHTKAFQDRLAQIQ